MSGADAVLLIAGALTPVRLGALIQDAAALGVAALVEVHDGAELDVAVDAGAPQLLRRTDTLLML